MILNEIQEIKKVIITNWNFFLFCNKFFHIKYKKYNEKNTIIQVIRIFKYSISEFFLFFIGNNCLKLFCYI